MDRDLGKKKDYSKKKPNQNHNGVGKDNQNDEKGEKKNDEDGTDPKEKKEEDQVPREKPLRKKTSKTLPAKVGMKETPAPKVEMKTPPPKEQLQRIWGVEKEGPLSGRTRENKRKEQQEERNALLASLNEKESSLKKRNHERENLGREYEFLKAGAMKRGAAAKGERIVMPK